MKSTVVIYSIVFSSLSTPAGANPLIERSAEQIKHELKDANYSSILLKEKLPNGEANLDRFVNQLTAELNREQRAAEQYTIAYAQVGFDGIALFAKKEANPNGGHGDYIQ